MGGLTCIIKFTILSDEHANYMLIKNVTHLFSTELMEQTMLNMVSPQNFCTDICLKVANIFAVHQIFVLDLQRRRPDNKKTIVIFKCISVDQWTQYWR